MKITKVVGYALSSPYGNGKVLGQPSGLKSIGIVEVHTDSGLVGFGETYAGIYVPEMIGTVVSTFADSLVGQDPLEPEHILERAKIPFVSRNGLFCSVYSAIDIALWDIKSQAQGEPVHSLLSNQIGAPRAKVKAYASGGSAAFGPKEIESDIERVVTAGFHAFKMRVGFMDWPQDLERVACARKALGSSGTLMIDTIMGTIPNAWNVTEASRKISDLAAFSPYWVEEPLHPDDLLGHIQLKESVNVKIASGEALTGLLDYRSFLVNKAVDFIQLDATHCGGLTVAARVIRLAKEYGIPVALHVWGSRLALAANAHLAFAFDNAEWLEVPTVSLELSSMIETDVIAVTNGEAVLAKGFEKKLKLSGALKEKYKFVPGTGFKWRTK